jgi:hypothetical protein
VRWSVLLPWYMQYKGLGVYGGSLEYQFSAASSKEMIKDFARVASSPPAEAIVAS